MKVLIVPILVILVVVAGCASHPNSPSSKPHNAYAKPLSTPGAKYGDLPQNIQRTVLAEAGTAEINDAIKETKGGRVIYKVTFRDADSFPQLIVGADGSVLNPDLTVAVRAPQGNVSAISLNDLPLKAQRTVQEHAAVAEVASINKETWGDHIIYIVSFKDEVHHPKLYVVADGTVVQEKSK
jgi:hypothetical protein